MTDKDNRIDYAVAFKAVVELVAAGRLEIEADNQDGYWEEVAQATVAAYTAFQLHAPAPTEAPTKAAAPQRQRASRPAGPKVEPVLTDQICVRCAEEGREGMLVEKTARTGKVYWECVHRERVKTSSGEYADVGACDYVDWG